MAIKHLTDDEVQQYVIDEQHGEMKIAEHVHFCEECRAKVEVYKLMITGIKERSQPAFDFDLSAVILNQLPAPALRTTNDKLLTWSFIFICTSLIGSVFWFFRGYLDSMFKGIGTISIYLIAISAITIIAGVFIEMFKRYQKEMKVLDLY